MKVLIIEDDPDVVELVSLCISIRWPDAKTIGVAEGSKGLWFARTEHPDLVVLDLGLPDVRGMEVLKKLRDFSNVPVIMLTGQDRDVDIATSLREGADDYVVKPFSQIELIARMEAVLRRSGVDVYSKVNTADIDDGKELYEGTVRLSVRSDGNVRLVVNFTQQVDTRPEIRLLRLGDNGAGAVDIWLGLREPIPLRSILNDLESVAEVVPAQSMVQGDGAEGTSIAVSLRAPQPA